MIRSVVMIVLVACGGSGSSGDVDAPGVGGDGGADGSVDAAPATGFGTCGTEVATAGDFSRGDALAFAADGTAYHSSFDGGESLIGRRVPGAAMDASWFGFGGVVNVDDLAVRADGRVYFIARTTAETKLQTITPSDTPVAVDLGAAFPKATALAFDPFGRLYAGTLGDGIFRVDPDTGARTPVSPGDQVSYLVAGPPGLLYAAIGTTGIVELTLDASGGEASRRVIFPFTTRAFQRLGVDELGRFYAIVREGGQEKILRFAADFTGEETLLMRAASGTSDFRDLAFGKGALACNVYVSGFFTDRHADGTTPGRP